MVFRFLALCTGEIIKEWMWGWVPTGNICHMYSSYSWLQGISLNSRCASKKEIYWLYVISGRSNISVKVMLSGICLSPLTMFHSQAGLLFLVARCPPGLCSTSTSICRKIPGSDFHRLRFHHVPISELIALIQSWVRRPTLKWIVGLVWHRLRLGKGCAKRKMRCCYQ